jgi:hypothetical protein
MPKLNPYLIPKENIPKTEEIRYLDQNYQPQSYEEFMKTYEPNEEVEVITEAEYQDRVLNGPQYGPGSNQSSYSDNSDYAKMERHYAKSMTGLGVTIVTKAAGPVGAIASGATGVITTAVGEIGHALSSSDEAKDAWKYTSELGQDMMMGYVAGNAVNGLRLPPVLKKGWDLWQEFKESGIKDKSMVNYHVYHTANGESYSSYCDVCKS